MVKRKLDGNVIYSKIGYNNAIVAKRNIFEIEANLLRIMKDIENFKELRKNELLYKIKIRKNLLEIKDNIIKILNEIPKTNKTKEIEKINNVKSKEKKIKKTFGIEEELAEIQRKLQEMNEKNY
ncbi:MAG: hypothetical protein QW727_00410 [Candidatus Pacearchaeota archaeon]